MKKKCFRSFYFILAFVITLQVFIPPKPSYAVNPASFAMKKATLYFFGGILSPWIASAVATAGACYTVYEVGKYLKKEHVGQKINDYWDKLTDKEKEYIEQNIESAIDGDEIDMTKIDKRIVDGYSSTMFESSNVETSSEIKSSYKIYNDFVSSYKNNIVEYLNTVPNLAYEIKVEDVVQRWILQDNEGKWQRSTENYVRDNMLPAIDCTVRFFYINLKTGEKYKTYIQRVFLTPIGTMCLQKETFGYSDKLVSIASYRVFEGIYKLCSEVPSPPVDFTLPANSISFYPPLSDTMPNSISLPDKVKIDDKNFELKNEIPIPVPIVGDKTIEINPTKPVDKPIDKPVDPPITKPTTWEWLKDLLNKILDGIKSIPSILQDILDWLKDIPARWSAFWSINWDKVFEHAQYGDIVKTKFKPFYDVTSLLSNIKASPQTHSGKFYMKIPKEMGGNDTEQCVLDLSYGDVYFKTARTLIKAALWVGFLFFIIKMFKPKFTIGG